MISAPLKTRKKVVKSLNYKGFCPLYRGEEITEDITEFRDRGMAKWRKVFSLYANKRAIEVLADG